MVSAPTTATTVFNGLPDRPDRRSRSAPTRPHSRRSLMRLVRYRAPVLGLRLDRYSAHERCKGLLANLALTLAAVISSRSCAR